MDLEEIILSLQGAAALVGVLGSQANDLTEERNEVAHVSVEQIMLKAIADLQKLNK